jgi:antitoxin ParD1/3/4
MNVPTDSSLSLTPEMRSLVQELIESGRFASAEQAVYGALLLLRESGPLDAEEVADLRDEVAIGLRQLDAGQGEAWDPDAVKARLRTRLASERSAG